MNKQDYLDALKRSLAGLPAEAVAKTLAYYEQRFVEGQGAGQTEEEVAAGLDEPRKIAMTLRASSHMSAMEKKSRPINLVRMAFSAVGLGIFNLFMVVPAAVFASLLAAMYACAFAFYVCGIAVTASGLSGANELVLDGPLRHVVMNKFGGDEDSLMETKVSIGENGIEVHQETAPGEEADDSDQAPDNGATKVIKRAESVAGRGLRISTDLDPGSRATQSFFGLGMVIGGILLFLIGLVVTKYTFIGIKRYLEMNFSLLRGN